jgi:hypothetical protein
MDTIQERHFITYAGNENKSHKINEIAEKKEIKKKIEEKDEEVAYEGETKIEEKDEEVACASETKIEEKDEEVYNENVWWFGV